MFKNILLIALRNINKNLLYSFLNILGLSLGITSALFLIVYISDELSYDNYHEKADRIYRVQTNVRETDDEFTRLVAQIPFAEQVVLDYPEVESACRFSNYDRALFSNREKEFIEEKFYYADTNVFNIFSYSFIYGNPATALARPNDIVLTKSIATKYFGNSNPIGKELKSDGGHSFDVTAVIEDVPYNSHFRFDALISRLNREGEYKSWGQLLVYTYLLVQENVNVDDLENKMQGMYPKYMASIFEEMGISIEYELMPIKRIHLYSDNAGEPEPTGSIIYVYIFGVVALFLILIAAMNYMNLATARSAKRAKEVGLRKVVGSSRGALIAQFLIESITLTVISLIICSLLMILLMPSFNQFAGKNFDATILVAPVVLASIIALIILVGLLGGSYPAFYLSKFLPIKVLKTGSISSKSGSFMRKILVVLQFSISVAMIVCTLVVFAQITHLENKDQGWNMENVICLSLPNGEVQSNMTLLKQRLLNSTYIQSAGTTNTHIGEGSGKGVFFVETSSGMMERGVNWTVIDHDFIKTFDIQMVEGRGFSEDIPSDTRLGVIVNQTLANRMGWEEPLGKKIERGDESRLRAKVVGVIKDYHQTGMYNQVESLLMQYRVDNPILYVKFKNNTLEAMDYVEKAWVEIFPDHPFNFEFLDERFEKQFTADRSRGIIFTIFTALAIFIACLGLFGLVSYTVEKRTREIGIRKVMGASSGAIVRLISREFLVLIVISMMIAFPISWYFMSNWLDNFVYSISMGIWFFVIAGLVALGLTVITISLQAIRAANTNPADTIKNI